jgi:hypothetical protein
MGLDMYLYRRKHLGKAKIETKILENEYSWYKNNNTTFTLENCTDILQEVGYWRKANAIHNWFVKSIPKGEHDCKEYYVPYEKLVELLKICKKVKEKAIIKIEKKEDWEKKVFDYRTIENTEEISKILPTQEGFFFGSIQYDEWYLEDIEYTIDLLEKLTKNDDENVDDYYYRSSW